MNPFTYFHSLAIAAVMLSFTGSLVFADSLTLIEDGQARAEIIIAEKPPRMVNLAAFELQRYLQKITKARLPIVHEPTAGTPVQIYVGRSEHTDKLGVTAEGLQYGACRIASGENWLMLIGMTSITRRRIPIPTNATKTSRPRPGPSGTKSQPNTPTLPGVSLTAPYTKPFGTRAINSRSCSKVMARTTASCGKRATTRTPKVDSGCRTKAVPSTPFTLCSDLWACAGLCPVKWARSCPGWIR